MRAHVCIWRQCNKDPSAALGMTVLGERIDSQGRLRRLFDWAMPESSILVTSRFYDTREGIGSHVWCQILRLSPHLFWLGLFTHRAFSSAQDDDTRGRKGSHLGDTLHVLELAVLYYDTSRRLFGLGQTRKSLCGTSVSKGLLVS